MSESKPLDENMERMIIKKSTYNSIIVGVIIAVGAATFLAGFLLANSTTGGNSYVTRSDLEDSVGKLESKLDSLQKPSTVVQPSAPSAPSLIKVSIDDDPMKGNADAQLTIIEFSDFQCPFCARFHEQSLSQIEENYVNTGKAKFVYRDFPLESIHPNAKSAALAAQCANEQGMFWDYHDKLFNGQSEWQSQGVDQLSTTFVDYATDLKLDSKQFESCYSTAKYAGEISKDSADAIQYGVTGTPTFFIGNDKEGFVKIVGNSPFALFQETINRQLG